MLLIVSVIQPLTFDTAFWLFTFILAIEMTLYNFKIIDIMNVVIVTPAVFTTHKQKYLFVVGFYKKTVSLSNNLNINK